MKEARTARARRALVCALATITTTLALGAGQAFAAQLTVDDDGADCQSADFTSIQAAVTAASPGDNIRVCAGVYSEQVRIPAGKDGLKLFSTPKGAAVIKAPPAMTDPGDIVYVAGARDVSIDRFVISGPLPDSQFCSDFTRTGVRIGTGGSASLADDYITEIRSATPALRGCQNGVAVLVGRRVEGEVGQAVLRDDVIDRYQKAGVVVDNAGSYADIQQTRIQGDGPNPTIAQNGIQVSRGADADVFKNIVTDNLFSPGTDSSSGLIAFETSGLAFKDNYVARNDLDFAGVGNFGPLTNSVVEKNQFLNATYDGIYMDEGTANNTLSQNFLRNNGLDCEDYSTGPGTAGTANFWLKNDGVTDNRAGQICSPKGGDKPGKQKEPKRRKAPVATP
jgi:parallel beta-helix repeat protein